MNIRVATSDGTIHEFKNCQITYSDKDIKIKNGIRVIAYFLNYQYWVEVQ